MKNAEKICQKWDSNPRLENQTVTWTQRLRPLGHPDSYTMNSDNIFSHIKIPYIQSSKVKVGVLRPFQQPGSYWDRSSELPLVGLEPTEVTAYD